MQVLLALGGAVPSDEPLERGFKLEAGAPAKVGARPGGVELEIAGLVDPEVGINRPGGPVTPELRHLSDDPLHRLGVVLGRTEVEGGGEAGGFGREQLFSKGDVAVEGLEDVLPGDGWRGGGG